MYIQIWSITYHSWLTFVFLLAACFLWIMPKKESRCLRFSPVVVVYAECLLILQYIYGFDLTNEELPDSLPGSGYRLDEIGLVKYSYPVFPLGIKVPVPAVLRFAACNVVVLKLGDVFAQPLCC